MDRTKRDIKKKIYTDITLIILERGYFEPAYNLSPRNDVAGYRFFMLDHALLSIAPFRDEFRYTLFVKNLLIWMTKIRRISGLGSKKRLGELEMDFHYDLFKENAIKEYIGNRLGISIDRVEF